MVGTYKILLEDEPIGEAIVRRKGLYYQFYCNCHLQSEVIYRVNVSCGGIHESLGILVPTGNTYGLTKMLPAKQFADGIPEFWLAPRHQTDRELHIDIYPEEPFAYITRLENAYLDIKSGKTAIVVRTLTT